MASEIILYDLPSKGRCACWSPNPWKTRITLNYLGVPYKTEWVEYPDIEPKFKDLGLKPNSSGRPYTIPAITLPSGEHLMDSAAIAPALQKLQPDIPLQFSNPATARAQDAIQSIFGGLVPILLPRVPKRLLNPTSVEYFERTRAESFGMTLAELEVSDKATSAWEDAKPGFEALAKLLKEDDSGPYVLGSTPGYADFIIVALFRAMETLGQDVFDETMAFDLSFPRLYAAAVKWMERDDH